LKKKKVFLAILLGFALWCIAYGLGYAGQKTITFQWDSNTEADMAGYKLYKGSAAGGPYTFIVSIPYLPGVPTQTSPTDIIVPDGTETVIYFVLTAYDISNNESGYSNEVNARIDFKPPGNPVQFIIKVISR
jgi:hypothetical protein